MAVLFQKLWKQVMPPPVMQSAPAPETVIDGIRYLYFGGTSYLGLAADPRVIDAGCDAMRRFGVHSATSRAGCGTTPPLLAVERETAAFFGTEDAFHFSSGYAGNHIVVQALAPEVDVVLVDEASHFCVQEASRLAAKPVLSFRHRDPEDLERQLGLHRRVLVMADAVGPATGALAPVLEYLRVLESRERGLVLLDDAHGFGVLGPEGRGWLEELGVWERTNRLPAAQGTGLFVVGTLAKALGGFGGILPGSSEWLARVRQASHYFDGASAPAAASAGASARALELVRSEPWRRSRLHENIARLRDGLRRMGIPVPPGRSAQVGIQVGDAVQMQRLHQELRSRGIWVPYFGAYSGLPLGGVLRIAVFATHTPDQIDHLLNALQSLI